MQFSKYNSTSCCKSNTNTSCSNTKQRYKNLRIILKLLNIISSFYLTDTTIDSHKFMFFIFELILDLIHNFHMMCKHKYFDSIL